MIDTVYFFAAKEDICRIFHAVEQEFSGMLFKRLVREVRRNCVKIKRPASIYIGKEMYKSKDRLVFSEERSGCFTLNEADEVKEWF